MTLIANVYVDGCFVLFGDTLISSVEKATSASIPNIDNLYEVFPKGAGFVPTGLRQKLCIINSNLMLAWAGNEIFALTALNEIRSKFLDESNFTEKLIANFFESLDDQIKNECQFCVVAANEEYSFCYKWNSPSIVGSSLGLIDLGGSGSEFFLDTLRYMETHFYEDNLTQSDEVRKTGSLTSAVGKILGLCGRLNTNEIFTGSNLLHYFGGAYEIAYRRGNKFEKLAEVTFITWVIDSRKNEILIRSTGIITKQFYVKDILFIRKLKFNVAPGKKGVIMDDHYYMIFPMSGVEIVNGEKVNIPRINSRFTCTGLMWLEDDSRAPALGDFLTMKNDSIPDLEFTFDEDEISGLEFSKEYVDTLKNTVLEKYGDRPLKYCL